MFPEHYYRPERSAAKEFGQWAQMLSGEIFVKIAVYIDESGRHDQTGSQKGSGQIAICGWVDWWENWANFCREWGMVLKKFKVCYFHFYEWVEASKVAAGREPASSFSKNPFRHLNKEQLDELLYEFAAIAGSGNKIFVGGFISTKDFVEAKEHPDYSRFVPSHGNPYRACLDGFFEGFSKELREQWPYWTEPVSFIFDHNDDLGWGHAVLDAQKAAKKKDPRIHEIVFADKKRFPHWPLQAADMLAYRMNQLARNFVDPKIIPNPSKLDDLLIKPTITRVSPAYRRGAISEMISLFDLRYGNYPWRKK
jgi:hypothetical protein